MPHDPHQRLVAALVMMAVIDATSDAAYHMQHQQEARQWLASDDALYWMGWLAPDGMDAEQIQQRALAMVEDDRR